MITALNWIMQIREFRLAVPAIFVAAAVVVFAICRSSIPSSLMPLGPFGRVADPCRQRQ